MPNEIIFFIMLIFVLATTLFAFHLGKYWLYGFVAVCIVLANIFVTKQFKIFGIIATGGNITYGAIFLSTDLLCEHYSKEEGKIAVYIGFFAAIFYLITSQLILLLRSAESDIVHNAMSTIFSFAPRIILASLTAYMVSQMHDIWFFNRLKEKTRGKMLWLRNNASTWLSQLIDSVIFTSIAFLGKFPFRIVFEIALSTYILKILVAAIDTPFIYFSYKCKPKL